MLIAGDYSLIPCFLFIDRIHPLDASVLGSQQRALLNRLIEWRQHIYGAIIGRNI
jgi:hypothetical protein